jgi:hypothetical protein
LLIECPADAHVLAAVHRQLVDLVTTVTELVYRHQLRPVIQTRATVMDELFAPK